MMTWILVLNSLVSYGVYLEVTLKIHQGGPYSACRFLPRVAIHHNGTKWGVLRVDGE